MKLLGIFTKQKAMPYGAFRDHVRLTVRRRLPGSKIEPSDTGFVLTVDGTAQACNLRQLYAEYSRNPADRDAVVDAWMHTLITRPPDHSWSEGRTLLRPMLKPNDAIAQASESMAKAGDNLPFEPFIGQLGVIVMREITGTLIAVTQLQLESWDVSFETALAEAMSNMNMMSFPNVTRELYTGGASKHATGSEVVGLVFEGDHMTATWGLMERFRDHIGMRLEGDFVFAIPNRNRLVAVRADEPGLIASVQGSNRNYKQLPYALTSDLFYVNISTTGGQVTVYSPKGDGTTLDKQSVFAPQAPARATAPASSAEPAGSRDLNSWYGMTEPTGTDSEVGGRRPAR